MAADLGLYARGMGLDGILMHGAPAGDVLDEFMSELDQQLSDNQIQ